MSYEDVRAVVGPRRTLEILDRLAEESPQNYSAIEDDLPTSSATLVDGLEVLIRYELVERIQHSAKDVEYAITSDGRTVLERCRTLDELLTRRNQA